MPKVKTTAGDKGFIRSLIRKHFPGLEVVDATAPLHLFPEKCDEVKGTRKDPALCMLHQTHERVHLRGGSLIWLEYAYFELPDEKGVMRVERFYIPPATRQYIETYDRTGEFKAGICVHFLAPKGAQTLEARRAITKRHYKTPMGKITVAVGLARTLERAAIRRAEADVEKLIAVKKDNPPSSPVVKMAVAAVKNSKVTVQQKHKEVVRAEAKRETLRKASTRRPNAKARYSAEVRSGHPGAHAAI